MRSPTTRRWTLGAAACALTGGMARAAPSSLPARPCLLVAGPAGGQVDRWADIIAPPLGRHMLGGGLLARDNIGGADGVTGVNQYQARTVPDGETALLLPGAALMAWLVGDSRVRFDVGNWAPLWGGTTASVVAARGRLEPGRPVRIAIPAIAGACLEALLALDMMGVEAVPVPMTAANGLRSPEIDAVYLRGAAAREPLAAYGFRPAFNLSARDPAFPDLPHAAALFHPARVADPVAAAAFAAVSSAAAIEVAMVLPSVAPATVLAWWRHGCDQLDAIRETAGSAAMHLDDAGEVATQLAAIAIDAPTMLALRAKLADRYHWRPN